ncbi:hypothetical protein [Chitinimonas sp.]|uniref:hypothetical protein n=1 Tax=Chitinimonas sp. TaxID=1934313 RepID=UPI0035AE2287
MMEFQISDDFVRRQGRKAVFRIVCCLAISPVLVVWALDSSSSNDKYWPIIGLVVLAAEIARSYKQISAGKSAYPVITLDEQSRRLVARHGGTEAACDLSQIVSLRLQTTSGELRSVLVKTASGEELRFVGYENLELLGASLERLTPQENIAKASIFHR